MSKSKLLSASVRVVVCVRNCYPSLFPLQNNSSRETTATAGNHYSMNAVTTHPHIKHPHWASSLCAQMENPTLLAPWWFGSRILRHRPENSPNTKGRRYAMENEDRRKQHTHDGHISSYRQPSILFLHLQLWRTPSRYLLSADTNEYDTFSFSQLVFYLNCSAQETQIKWCVLHAWIFQSISARGTLPRRILRHQSRRLQNIPKYTIDQMLLSEQNTWDQLQFCYQREILVW